MPYWFELCSPQDIARTGSTFTAAVKDQCCYTPLGIDIGTEADSRPRVRRMMIYEYYPRAGSIEDRTQPRPNASAHVGVAQTHKLRRPWERHDVHILRLNTRHVECLKDSTP